VECHLLLPAPASESHLALTLQAFGALPLASVLLSKVDETEDMAGCINQLCLSGLSVSYLTTGPRVPEDVEAATAARLASLILASRRPEPVVAAATPLGEVALHADE
jgi:flagellar biosynthesis protein FlhF